MRTFLIISILLFNTLVIFSQGLERKYSDLEKFLIKKTIDSSFEILDINRLDLVKSDEIKKPLVDKLRRYEYLEYLVDNYGDFKYDFKTIDLNNDGKLDIFYSGYLAGASDSYAYIFINTSDGFKKSFDDFPGLFLFGIKKNQEFSGLIYVYEGFHGDGPELCKIEILTFDSTGNTNIRELVKYPNFTKIPTQYFEKEIEFTVKNEKYYLRSEPGEQNGVIIGEIHDTYTSGDKGRAFASETDSTGRVWWYVIMDNGIAGWMSSRYLEVL